MPEPTEITACTAYMHRCPLQLQMTDQTIDVKTIMWKGKRVRMTNTCGRISFAYTPTRQSFRMLELAI